MRVRERVQKMAYTLESLIIILQKIMNPDEKRWDFDNVKPQLESLRQIATSLQKILETRDLESGPKMERIERQIQDAAHEAEDIIESNMVNQMIPGSASFTIYPPDLEQVTQQLHSVMGFLMEIIDGNSQSQISTNIASSSAAAPRSKSDVVVVGVEKDLEELKDRLTSMKSNLEVIPIVGMGGIGKTTLARNLYQDPSIVSHFQYAHAWATISQDYNIKTILSSILRCIIGKEADKHIKKEYNELKDILYQSLYGRRYLIVLDDIWSNKFWDEMRKYFPDNNNRSRIVITTRVSGVAKHADSRSPQYEMQLLNKSVSWQLLHQIVFKEADCPHDLQEIGEKIAGDCGGLPLAISVIGGLLSKVERSEDVWERIATDVRLALANSDEQFSNILSLSYNHLPYHLKPCFLYMAAFNDISTSRLTGLWVAEGFVKAKGEKSLEEEAEDYLTALVERNMLIVRGTEFKWKTKSYSVHDLMRDLCIRKADEEKFLHVNIVPKATFYSPRRLYAYSPPIVVGGDLVLALTRSLIIDDYFSFEDLKSSFPTSRLVRVLNMWYSPTESSHFPTEILQLVNLRYLCIFCDLELPFIEISRALWNLQTLIIFPYCRPEAIVEIPTEVWELPELRCIKIHGDGVMIRYGGYRRLRTTSGNMQKISMIQLHRLNDCNFFTAFPNIRSLKLNSFSWELFYITPLEHLQKLEKLICSSFRPFTNQFLCSLRLPSSLRKLTLTRCAVPMEFMASLCQLLHLQILRIGDECEFTNVDGIDTKEWVVEDGDEFRSLQYLHLDDLSLRRWTADETNFPRLRHLIIMNCYSLEGIPGGIGEIPTLALIEVKWCGKSVVESAKKIVEEQQSEYDNYDLHFRTNT